MMAIILRLTDVDEKVVANCCNKEKYAKKQLHRPKIISC